MDLTQRLSLLRERVQVLEMGGADVASSSSSVRPEAAQIRFRNYTPRNERIADTSEEVEEVGEAGTGLQDMSVSVLVTSSKDVLAKELAAMGEDGAMQLVPKHPNWDLKANIESRMCKLRRRTQRAIVDILREKMATEGAQ
jgi:coiled-coil domain-containing protein 12